MAVHIGPLFLIIDFLCKIIIQCIVIKKDCLTKKTNYYGRSSKTRGSYAWKVQGLLP